VAENSTFAAGFDEAAFRNAIVNSMRMGMAVNPAEQLTWYWKRNQTFNPQDRTDRPYNWSQTPVTDAPGNPDEPDGSLVVDYALEFTFAKRSGGRETALGQLDAASAVVTLMDDAYELVKTADYAMIGNSRYEIEFTAPAIGLFSVGVYQIYLRAVDEA
jgi:hypothetical protein